MRRSANNNAGVRGRFQASRNLPGNNPEGRIGPHAPRLVRVPVGVGIPGGADLWGWPMAQSTNLDSSQAQIDRFVWATDAVTPDIVILRSESLPNRRSSDSWEVRPLC